ncbi:MAG: twin-arginine translocase TatA/TatE family subunit [Lachnospiraceae bacterium]|nr:twin-arginine translocase TatA/TatE family subunit [Lachnospiraceae bacterium]
MAGIGFGEILLILLVAFIIVGPEDLPKLARKVGKQVKKLKTLMREINDDINIDPDKF